MSEDIGRCRVVEGANYRMTAHNWRLEYSEAIPGTPNRQYHWYCTQCRRLEVTTSESVS